MPWLHGERWHVPSGYSDTKFKSLLQNPLALQRQLTGPQSQPPTWAGLLTEPSFQACLGPRRFLRLSASGDALNPSRRELPGWTLPALPMRSTAQPALPLGLLVPGVGSGRVSASRALSPCSGLNGMPVQTVHTSGCRLDRVRTLRHSLRQGRVSRRQGQGGGPLEPPGATLALAFNTERRNFTPQGVGITGHGCVAARGLPSRPLSHANLSSINALCWLHRPS